MSELKLRPPKRSPATVRGRYVRQNQDKMRPGGLGALKRRPYNCGTRPSEPASESGRYMNQVRRPAGRTGAACCATTREKAGRKTQREVTPLIKFRKKGRLPKVWPTMPGQVFFVPWATKDRARPVMAMRVVSHRVGCMKRWKADHKIP